MNKNGRPLAKVARSAAVTYPEVLPGRFDAEDFDNRIVFDELTEPLISLINEPWIHLQKSVLATVLTIEFLKRKIYYALSDAAKEDNQYSYYSEQLAGEYEGQGKRSDNGNKGSDTSPKA